MCNSVRGAGFYVCMYVHMYSLTDVNNHYSVAHLRDCPFPTPVRSYLAGPYYGRRTGVCGAALRTFACCLRVSAINAEPREPSVLFSSVSAAYGG
jgi:hypothetical protein